MNVGAVQNTQAKHPVRKAVKTIAGTVAATGLVAAGLVYGAKTGKFAVSEESSKLAKKVLPYLDKAGNQIAKIAKPAVEYVSKVAKPVVDFVTNKAQKVKETAVNVFNKVKDSAFVAEVKKMAANAKNMIKNIFSKPAV